MDWGGEGHNGDDADVSLIIIIRPFLHTVTTDVAAGAPCTFIMLIQLYTHYYYNTISSPPSLYIFTLIEGTTMRVPIL